MALVTPAQIVVTPPRYRHPSESWGLKRIATLLRPQLSLG